MSDVARRLLTDLLKSAPGIVPGGRLSGSEAGSDAVKSSGQALPQAGLLLGLHSLEPGGVGHGVGGVLEGGGSVDALAAVVAVAVALVVVAAWKSILRGP